MEHIQIMTVMIKGIDILEEFIKEENIRELMGFKQTILPDEDIILNLEINNSKFTRGFNSYEYIGLVLNDPMWEYFYFIGIDNTFENIFLVKENIGDGINPRIFLSLNELRTNFDKVELILNDSELILRKDFLADE